MAGLWIRTGTVAVTDGSLTVTGTGTRWQEVEAGPKKGQLILIVGSDGSQFVGEVDSVSSHTKLMLVTPYRGPSASGLAYAIDTFRANTAADLSSQIARFLARYDEQIGEWDERLDLIPAQLEQATANATDSASSAAASAASASEAAEHASSAGDSAHLAAVASATASAITGWRVSMYAELYGLAPGAVVAAFVCDRAGRLPRTLIASQFRLLPAGSAVLSLIVNQFPVATLTFTDGNPAAAITPLLTEDMTLAAGDVVTITYTFAAGWPALAATLVIPYQ